MKGGNRKGLGSTGERLALEHLLDRGYELLATNWRSRYGEIDLIVRERSTIVFVEVRTRRGDGRGTPEESITRRKSEKLALLAQQWIAKEYPDSAEPDWRIDVVGVHLSGSGRLIGINHIPGAVGF